MSETLLREARDALAQRCMGIGPKLAWCHLCGKGWAIDDPAHTPGCLIARLDAALSATPAAAQGGAWQPTHRHYKGGLYRLIGQGRIEATLQHVAVYENEKGEIWVRPWLEFHGLIGDQVREPRFERLPASPTAARPDPRDGVVEASLPSEFEEEAYRRFPGDTRHASTQRYCFMEGALAALNPPARGR